MSIEYYVHLNNANYGPYTVGQIRAMVAKNIMQMNTLVFKKGGPQQWLPVQNFPELLKSAHKNDLLHAADPTQTSVPLKANRGDIEKNIWKGRPSAWKLIPIFIKNTLIFVLTWGVYILAIALLLPNTQLPDEFHKYNEYVITIPLGISLVIILKVAWELFCWKTTGWVASTQRIVESKGVFSRKMITVELYRVKDFKVIVPFLWRLIGYGYLVVFSSSQYTRGDLTIGPVKDPNSLLAMFRKYVERQRSRTGGREIDIFQT